MCKDCGCSHDSFSVDHGEHGHTHEHEHEHGAVEHSHEWSHHHETSATRAIKIEQDLLHKNDLLAAENRGFLRARGVYAVNLVSSPGSGKTTLLAKSLQELKDRLPVAVIEGDQQTSLDAERIRATGVKAVQINTGRGCHLDAHMVGHVIESMNLQHSSILFIENVGNLVCPAEFDLGEQAKIAILSVTEGEDKPLKYPTIFANAKLMILTKIDLLPHLSFDVERCMAYAKRVNPSIEIIQLSAVSGQGMSIWLDWLQRQRDKTLA